MCMSSNIGVKIKLLQDKSNIHEYLFGEDQSRYIVEINESNKDEVSNILKKIVYSLKLLVKLKKIV